MSSLNQVWINKFDPLDKFIFISAAFFAILFMATGSLLPYSGDFIVKAIPAFFLGLLALKHVHGTQGIFLFIGMCFCAAGDIALVHGKKHLLLGIAFFLVGHIFLILTFRRDFLYRPYWTPVALMLIFYGACMLIFLIPLLGKMLFPVAAYLSIIVSMGIFAVFREQKSKIVFYGALLFLLSDSLIALNVFIKRDPYSSFMIGPTYFLALFMIAGGYLFDAKILEKK